MREVEWSAVVHTAHAQLQNTYNHALRIFLDDGGHLTRIVFHIDRISTEALPLLFDLSPSPDEAPDGILPIERLETVSGLLGQAVYDLRSKIFKLP